MCIFLLSIRRKMRIPTQKKEKKSVLYKVYVKIWDPNLIWWEKKKTIAWRGSFSPDSYFAWRGRPGLFEGFPLLSSSQKQCFPSCQHLKDPATRPSPLRASVTGTFNAPREREEEEESPESVYYLHPPPPSLSLSVPFSVALFWSCDILCFMASVVSATVS